ncbi:MAG: hypothetical protein ACOX6M_10240 [Armatimonadota bacterium]
MRRSNFFVKWFNILKLVVDKFYYIDIIKMVISSYFLECGLGLPLKMRAWAAKKNEKE